MCSKPATNSSRSSGRTGRTMTVEPSRRRTRSSSPITTVCARRRSAETPGNMWRTTPSRVVRKRRTSGGDDMADTQTQASGEELEKEIEKLLDQEKFEPPEDFKANALWSDPSVYEEANKDWKAWWAKQAEELHWFSEWDEILDDSNPPFYKWFTGGKINASYNCLDRHVEAGIGDRVAFHWRGEEGEERDVTYAELLRDTQKCANALKDLGVEKGDIVGIYLPMIPEVVVAMLACARIGAIHNVVFGGFSVGSVKERMEF